MNRVCRRHDEILTFRNEGEPDIDRAGFMRVDVGDDPEVISGLRDEHADGDDGLDHAGMRTRVDVQANSNVRNGSTEDLGLRAISGRGF
ncbi:hypothetical protein MBEBAB_0063 [Brevundimonas abyssalis TAR-001]|uniref:Uncharacterized protein n=1 Tax=Brevundimonas abyssalis TAR-001 TaxID=1391729 RepID=A0A8E0KGV2_9CAUL|nr:hypothetical protein MBEBAB_0063 [Brevundimonas abyssalis TAR-001]